MLKEFSDILGGLGQLPVIVALVVIVCATFIIAILLILRYQKQVVDVLKEIIESQEKQRESMAKSNDESHKGKLLHFSDESRKKDELIKSIIAEHLNKNNEVMKMVVNGYEKFAETIHQFSLAIERYKYQRDK